MGDNKARIFKPNNRQKESNTGGYGKFQTARYGRQSLRLGSPCVSRRSVFGGAQMT